MSASFTNTSAKDLQSLTLYNELQLAYSERRQALGQSAQDAFAEDAFIQKRSMWTAWQSWLETYCTSFLNYDGGGVICDSDTGLENFTLATFRAKAGLNADGFTRHYRIDRTTAGTAYGIAQVDDYVGPWLIDELQAAFSVLRYSALGLTFSQVESKEADGIGWGDTWALAYAAAQSAAEASYAADPNMGEIPGHYTWARAYGVTSPGVPPYGVQAVIVTCAWEFETTLDARAAFIGNASLITRGLFNVYPGTPLEQTYDDGDHDVPENWNVGETVNVVDLGGGSYKIVSTARTHGSIKPWPATVPYWDYPDGDSYSVYRGYEFGGSWVLNWDFTNQD